MPKPTNGLFYLTVAVEPQNYGLVKAGLLDTRQVKIVEDVYVEYDQTIPVAKGNQNAQQVLAALPTPAKSKGKGKSKVGPSGRPSLPAEFKGLTQPQIVKILLARFAAQGRTQVSTADVFSQYPSSTHASISTCLAKMTKEGALDRVGAGIYKLKGAA